MKNIINKNNKGQLHGHQEWYYFNGKLLYKFFCYNDIEVDYEECYNCYNGKLARKTFYI